jgi:PEP-CTERM motif
MMKRLLLTLALLSMLAMPAVAYVQPGHLPGGNPGRNDVPRDGSDGTDPFGDPFDHGSQDRGVGGGGGGRGDGEDDPTRPVPEPGTMALAAMGLAALGAASRRRRAN